MERGFFKPEFENQYSKKKCGRLRKIVDTILHLLTTQIRYFVELTKSRFIGNCHRTLDRSPYFTLGFDQNSSQI